MIRDARAQDELRGLTEGRGGAGAGTAGKELKRFDFESQSAGKKLSDADAQELAAVAAQPGVAEEQQQRQGSRPR